MISIQKTKQIHESNQQNRPQLFRSNLYLTNVQLKTCISYPDTKLQDPAHRYKLAFVFPPNTEQNISFAHPGSSFVPSRDVSARFSPLTNQCLHLTANHIYLHTSSVSRLLVDLTSELSSCYGSTVMG